MLEAGNRRCLGHIQSGLVFLQDITGRYDTKILLNAFFESLMSNRRLVLITDILAQFQSHIHRAMLDRFTAFECLDDFDIYVGGGQFIVAASNASSASPNAP